MWKMMAALEFCNDRSVVNLTIELEVKWEK